MEEQDHNLNNNTNKKAILIDREVCFKRWDKRKGISDASGAFSPSKVQYDSIFNLDKKDNHIDLKANLFGKQKNDSNTLGKA